MMSVADDVIVFLGIMVMHAARTCGTVQATVCIVLQVTLTTPTCSTRSGLQM
jgi:hypothetical protein